jgi:histidine triad (HIT) family protein
MEAQNIEPSIFTKIIQGEIPCHKIYEDEQVIVFLDIHPVQPGHTLVVPKQQVPYLWDLDEITYQAVMLTAKRVAQHLRNEMGTEFVGEQVVGVDVAHAHIHLIPFNTAEEFRNIPNMNVEPDHSVLAKLAEKLHMSEN